MINISDEDIIIDIQRVARILNTNQMSFTQYLENGGKYSKSSIDEFGGFASRCELAGIKGRD